ncbi:hypothetical protein H0X06_06960 [Candidatus Dependentiae bacterium]|nr:hypothetical protein [Candidatus Dependentiae bacterium]
MLTKLVEILKLSWRESLEALQLQLLGRFLLLSLRTFTQIYLSLPFAWFFPTALLAGLILGNTALLYSFYIVLLARAARPSIELKRTAYWRHFTPADWILFLSAYCYQSVPLVTLRDNPVALTMYHTVSKIFLLEGNSWFSGSAQLGILPFFFSPLIIIWVLFMLDAQKTIIEQTKAFFRAVTMMVYNYPFFLISYEVLRVLIVGGYLLTTVMQNPHPSLYLLGWIVLFMVIIPLYVSFITNYYVKRVHDQFTLYYKA